MEDYDSELGAGEIIDDGEEEMIQDVGLESMGQNDLPQIIFSTMRHDPGSSLNLSNGPQPQAIFNIIQKPY
jgi:hypothetical protein